MVFSMNESNPQEIVAENAELSGSERFLRIITKVLRDRSLYPESHPQTLAGEKELHGILPQLFVERTQRTFVIIDEYVYIDDRLMSGKEKGLSEVAKVFRACQVEVLTISEGLSIAELHSFINHLVTTQNQKDSGGLYQSPHIQLGKLSVGEGGRPSFSPGKAMEHFKYAVPKKHQNQPAFSDETKILQDVYVDWNTAQGLMAQHAEKVMHTLEVSLFSNLHSFIPLGELKSYDEYTYVHAINLSMLTMAQAQLLGFSKEAIHAFGMGALLHDVGKTQVSVNVLNKQGKLTPEEFEEMKRHPLEGALLLMQYPEIPKIAAIVAYEHHLNFNQSGYPAVKWGRPQHIASRLTAISDQFDAMRSNRPYRDALETEKIYEIMEGNKGTDLDPDLLDHFFAMMKSRKVL